MGTAIALLMAFIITVGEVLIFIYACALALASLVNAYFAFKESKFYEKFVILIKEWNGDITGIEGEVGPDDSVTIHKEERISQSDSDKTMNNALNKAEAEGSTIDGKSAVRLTPTKDVQNALNERVKKGR